MTEHVQTPAADATALERVMFEVKRVIVGQERLVERMVVSLLAQGHCLLEGVPGVAKTLAVETLARTVSGSFGITGSVDTILVMANTASGSVLDVRGRDVESAEFAIQFSRETCRWTVLGDAAAIYVSEQRARFLAK